MYQLKVIMVLLSCSPEENGVYVSSNVIPEQCFNDQYFCVVSENATHHTIYSDKWIKMSFISLP